MSANKKRCKVVPTEFHAAATTTSARWRVGWHQTGDGNEWQNGCCIHIKEQDVLCCGEIVSPHEVPLDEKIPPYFSITGG